MKSWLRGIVKPTTTVAAEYPPIPDREHGLYLELDESGCLLHRRGSLSAGLKEAVPGTPFWQLLAEPLAWGLADLPSLQGQLVELSLLQRDGGHLQLRGWLGRLGSGWFMQLLDVSDQARRGQQLERRLQLLGFSSRMAQRLRMARASDLEGLVLEVLEGFVLRLGLLGAGLLVPRDEGTGWRLYHHYQLPGTRQPFPDAQSLAELLELQPGTGPRSASLSCLGPRAEQPLWLVPYFERLGARAWLVCLGETGKTALGELAEEDWQQLVASLAAPLLQQLREAARQAESARNGLLQSVLGSGWWEYRPALGAWQLAPALRTSLGLGERPNADWLTLLHPAEQDEFQVRLADAALLGQGFVQSLRLRAGDGWRWYRISVEVQGQGDGQRIIGFAVDINDIKVREAEAAAAITRLESLVDSAPAVIYVQRYEEGALRPEFYSASLEMLLGWSLADLREQTLLSLVHADDRAAFLERTRQLLREGKVSCHYRIRDRRGGYHWMLDEAKLLRDDWGQPQEVVGLYLDVSEAREADERMRCSEERYRLLVEDSPAVICRYRPDLSLSFANRTLLDYLECPAESVGQLSLGNYLSAEQREALLQRVARMTPERPVATAEICMQLPGHEHAWWLWAERGVFDAEGRLVEIQAVGRDDTELHRSRQQLYQSAKMATLGEMSTAIVHEINQPLNVMHVALVNLLKRLESDLLTPDYLRGKLERIEGQVQRAARIVEHMRTFGRRAEVDRQQFQPCQAIDGAVTLLREGLEKQGIRLELVLDPMAKVSGHGDQLEQVLINLLVNARDALLARRGDEALTPARIRLGAGMEEGRVRIEVEDNAGGVEPRLLARVFEPFFTTKPAGEGTGLGLSLSYGIIRQMGGELGVCNKRDGACFTLTLPVAESVESDVVG